MGYGPAAVASLIGAGAAHCLLNFVMRLSMSWDAGRDAGARTCTAPDGAARNGTRRVKL